VKGTHTHFSRGTRLRIVLRDGTVRVRWFVDRHGRTMEVVDEHGVHEHIQTRCLKNCSIYKGPANSRAVRHDKQ
jgi:hypothetical protein